MAGASGCPDHGSRSAIVPPHSTRAVLTPALIAAAVALFLGALWTTRRTPGALLAAIFWLLYAPYEYLVYARVLCSGECNIRVDLLLFWPLLAIVTLAVPIWAARRRASHRS